jgi:hypothetical protein
LDDFIEQLNKQPGQPWPALAAALEKTSSRSLRA